MPKVTDEHRERRRQQILDAARECFVRKGFHQTSMADVFEASGLSSGAVYGYFRSKDEIIAAIADEVMNRVENIVTPAIANDPPPTLDALVLQMLRGVEATGFGDKAFARLAPQVWSEAGRSDVLGEMVGAEYVRVRTRLAELIRRHQDAGEISTDRPAEQIAQVVFGAVLGYIVQQLVTHDVDPVSYADGLAALLSS